MFSLFSRLLVSNYATQHSPPTPPALPHLDAAFYPWHWQQQNFASALSIANTALANLCADSASPVDLAMPTAYDVANALLAHRTYQEWINFTVFGRYVQRSFVAFQRQTQDSFNTDMPDLLRHELHRYAQILPDGQILFFAGELSTKVRRERLLTTTLNPIYALQSAQDLSTKQTCLNVITIGGERVKGFAVKHNSRTRDKIRCEVMILEFTDLRLTQEQVVAATPSQPDWYIRHYLLR